MPQAHVSAAVSGAASAVVGVTEVAFFRPDIGNPEIEEVVAALKSGWLTTGPKVKQFEREFAAAVGAPHAVALNSATAALHLAIEALGVRRGDGVLVPTMTFAATAEVLHYLGAVPVLVDCDPATLNLDIDHAEAVMARPVAHGVTSIVGIMPVHVGGLMLDIDALQAFARRHNLWIVEDAAHAFPAAWRRSAGDPWQRCGEHTASVTAFSFYANKTITTGEGGMATSSDAALVERMRLMSLHGLSRDAWDRYTGGRSWDYRIVAPGYKYNLTDIAAAIGIPQLHRAEEMRQKRERIARAYLDALADVTEIALPATDANRVHAWHLFPIRLRLDALSVDRDRFIDQLREHGVGCSVHWRPLHLHPYYQERFALSAADYPVASKEFARLVSLPIFSSMTDADIHHVVATVRRLTQALRRVT